MAKLCSAFLRMMGNGIVFSLLGVMGNKSAFLRLMDGMLPLLRWPGCARKSWASCAPLSQVVKVCFPLEERCASRVSHSKRNQKSSQTRVMGKLCSTFQDGQVVLTFQGRDVSWLCQFSGHLRGSYLGLNNADAADLQHVRKNVWKHENI